jgi:hypothetical protein
MSDFIYVVCVFIFIAMCVIFSIVINSIGRSRIEKGTKIYYYNHYGNKVTGTITGISSDRKRVGVQASAVHQWMSINSVYFF